MSIIKKGYLRKGILLSLFLILLIIVPLFFILSHSLIDFKTQAFTLENWKLVFQTNNLIAITNSLKLALAVTILSTLLATPLSFFLYKTKLSKIWWLTIIMMIPLMIPPYINSLGWMLFMQRNGILWRLSEFFHPLSDEFYSFYGMVWIMSMHTFPFLTTILLSAYKSIPSNIDDSCTIYSKNKFRSFFKIYMPIVFPNYIIGAFLVFVKALSEYGTPATFGARINYYVFTTIITNYMQVSPIDFNMASALASLLVFLCMILWTLQVIMVERRSYNLVPDYKNKINKKVGINIFGTIFIILLFFLSTIIPVFTIFISSLKRVTYKNIFEPNNFTLDNFRIALFENEGFGSGIDAFGNTLFVSFISSLIVLVLGIIIGIFVRRNRRKKVAKLVELFSTLPQMIPNIVTGIGLIMFYNAIYKFLPIYRTKWMLILGYSIILLPGMYTYIKNSLTQMSESILEAGSIFGKNEFMVDMKIVLPIASKGAVYGFIMTLIVAFRELMLAKLLQAPTFYTVSLYIDSQFEQGNQQAAMVLAFLSILFTLIILLPLEFISRRKERKI